MLISTPPSGANPVTTPRASARSPFPLSRLYSCPSPGKSPERRTATSARRLVAAPAALANEIIPPLYPGMGWSSQRTQAHQRRFGDEECPQGAVPSAGVRVASPSAGAGGICVGGALVGEGATIA